MRSGLAAWRATGWHDPQALAEAPCESRSAGFKFLADGGEEVRFHAIEPSDGADVMKQDSPAGLRGDLGFEPENPREIIDFLVLNFEENRILRFPLNEVLMGFPALIRTCWISSGSPPPLPD
jgi:hypothetical protein